MIAARELRYAYPREVRPALRGVSLSVAAGELVGIVGPNGSGKTTLVRLLVGLLRPDEGAVEIDGRPLRAWSRRELARAVGVVPQREEPVFPLTVREAVAFGRYPHLGPLGRPGARDVAAVERALARCDALELADRWVGTLSGGEWQRVRIARALAQEPKVLILDEPTASLDIRHEMEVFELTAELVRAEGLSGIVITHHVNLAVRFVDRLLVLDRGEPRAWGPPTEALTASVFSSVFQWPVDILSWQGFPLVVPRRMAESETSRTVPPEELPHEQQGH